MSNKYFMEPHQSHITKNTCRIEIPFGNYGEAPVIIKMTVQSVTE